MSETGHWVAIGLGANLGDRGQALAGALQALAGLPDTQLLAVSSLYRTAPMDSSGPDYLNAVAAVRTTLAPLAMLDALQSIELAAGRERPFRNAPRTLDLDIELWGDERIEWPRLTVPHPRMHERAFVLVPLAEIAPQRVTPAQLQTVAAQAIERIAGPQWHLGEPQSLEPGSL
jgi:2-amino-4-hydroxy-6-hydroxymethyldihydropteridine diphosphokinase